MSTERRGIGSFGIQTAAVAASGYTTTQVTNVEEYDGTNWSNGTAVPTAASSAGTAGTETAGLFFGGINPSSPTLATTLEYDGSNWTSGGSLITSRWGLNGGPVGTQSDSFSFWWKNTQSWKSIHKHRRL